MLDRIYSDLAAPVRLADLAELADLSPFHFHRVFQAMVGETPSDFVKRLRLEKAVSIMSHGKHKSLTAVALECGFTSSSDFTRSFKLRYGVAPSKFDVAQWQAQQERKIAIAASQSPFHVAKPLPRSNPDHFRVRIRELPPRYVAYIRVSNPYQGDGVVQAAHRLMDWADKHHLADGQWLGYQYENPKVTALESCHYYVAVEVPFKIATDRDVGWFRFPAMKVAEIEMKGDIQMEIRLFQWLYGSWLPRSNYRPADFPGFEVWNGRPFAHGYEYFELRIHLPIQEL